MHSNFKISFLIINVSPTEYVYIKTKFALKCGLCTPYFFAVLTSQVYYIAKFLMLWKKSVKSV